MGHEARPQMAMVEEAVTMRSILLRSVSGLGATRPWNVEDQRCINYGKPLSLLCWNQHVVGRRHHAGLWLVKPYGTTHNSRRPKKKIGSFRNWSSENRLISHCLLFEEGQSLNCPTAYQTFGIRRRELLVNM